MRPSCLLDEDPFVCAWPTLPVVLHFVRDTAFHAWVPTLGYLTAREAYLTCRSRVLHSAVIDLSTDGKENVLEVNWPPQASPQPKQKKSILGAQNLMILQGKI